MKLFPIPGSRPFISLWGVCSVVIAVVALWALPADAQAARRLIDSHGRDFWITFLPNYHNYKMSNPDRSDSLYIFIAALRPTNGMITYRDRNGQEFQEPFAITNPAQIYSFRIRDGDFELEGFNNSGTFLANGGQGERIAPQSFHVTAEDDITVYALSQAELTSDAFLVLPTDAVGRDYLIMSYTSDNIPTQNGIVSATPSQFAIVATEDATEVTITPAGPTFINRSATQNVTLNRGDSYLVQAYMGSGNSLTTDLTGTKVESDKPIAIFAGHQRATLPQWGTKVSRDVLIEQVASVDTWGLSAFITPYEQPEGTSLQTVNDLFRVLAAFDNTEVFIDGVLTATLSAGGYYESVIRRASHITATAPVLVAQFKESASTGFGGGNSTKTGDPFLMLIPPSEQFLNYYRFINVQAMGQGIFGQPEITYVEQYVTIIAPDNKLTTVQLDDTPVNSGVFSPIGTSGYSYASIRVSDGVHTVRADTGIGVYVYGYGEANSYGYIGGTNYSPVDFLPPRMELKADCFEVTGLLLDDLPSDYHIERIDIPAGFIENVSVTVDEFRDIRDSARLVARLIDPYMDGSFRIGILDSSGLRIDTTCAIPGFTVRAALAATNTDIPYERHNVEVRSVLCASYELVNTGRFPQTITSLDFAQATPGFSVQTPLPIVIPPGGRVTIELCFSPQKRGSFSDTLLIGNDCLERAAWAFTVVTGSAKITLQVLDASANPGRQTEVKIKMLYADGLDWAGVDRLEATLSYNASILAYRGQNGADSVDGRNGYVKFQIPVSFTADSIVASLRFYAGLGSDSVSGLVLDTAFSIDGGAEVELLPGRFVLTGICYDGGVRLLNPSGRIALAPPRPNPAMDATEIDVETVEAGRTRLEVVDLLGRTVAVPFDGELDTGLHVLSFDVGQLGSGRYHLVLKTPTEMIVQRLEVVR